jgi:hypothetical protein
MQCPKCQFENSDDVNFCYTLGPGHPDQVPDHRRGLLPFFMILYELFVRRINIMRFFFGMRPKKKPSATPVPRP